VTLAGLALASTCLWAGEPAFYLEGGLGRKQGNFGTAIDSQLGVVYGAVGYASSTYDLNVSVPFLRLDEQGGGQSASAMGVGDVLIRGVRRLVPETEGGFALDVELALKLPTSDSNQGLGTGTTDIGGFLAIHQRWGRLEATLLGGWIRVGTSSANPALQTGIYSLGAGFSCYLDGTKWSLTFGARGGLYAGAVAPRDLTLDAFHLVSQRVAVKALYSAGLSDGAPRASFGLGLVYWP
jgi:hypothetical protein